MILCGTLERKPPSWPKGPPLWWSTCKKVYLQDRREAPSKTTKNVWGHELWWFVIENRVAPWFLSKEIYLWLILVNVLKAGEYMLLSNKLAVNELVAVVRLLGENVYGTFCPMHVSRCSDWAGLADKSVLWNWMNPIPYLPHTSPSLPHSMSFPHW